MQRAGVGDRLQRAQEARRQLVEAAGDPLVDPIGGENVLHQVVGADREEVGGLGDLFDLPQQRRHLDHRAELDVARRLAAAALHEGDLLVEQRARREELGDRRHHRDHHLELAAGGGAQHRPKLGAQQAGPVEAHADRPPAERRVRLVEPLHVRQHLVAADVEGAKGDDVVAGRVEHRAIDRLLGVDAREAVGEHELQLGAEQSDRLRAGLVEMRHVDQQAGVHVQADRHAVDGDARRVAQRAVLVLPARAQPRLFGVGRLDVRLRAHLHFAGHAVDDDRVALFDDLGDVGQVADGGDRQGARDDGDVARRARFLQHHAAQPRAVVVEQRRRAHRARDQDRVVRQLARLQHQALAGELVQQAVGDVGQVVQAIAQIGVGLALQPGAGVVLHPLDRRLGGQAARHRLAQPAQPAAVVGDHPERLQHLAMLAGAAVVAAVDQRVDRGAHRLDRLLQPVELHRDVVGDDLRHRDARLVQDDVAEAEPLGDRLAGQRFRPPRRDRRALAGDRLQLARWRSFRPAASPSSAAPRSPPRNRCAARGSAPPARRASRRRAAPARRGTTGRSLRRSPACRRRRDGSARRRAQAARRWRRSGRRGLRPASSSSGAPPRD